MPVVIGYIPAFRLKSHMESPSTFVCDQCGFKAQTNIDKYVHKTIYKNCAKDPQRTAEIGQIDDVMKEFVIFHATMWHGTYVHDPHTRYLKPGMHRCLEKVCNGDVEKFYVAFHTCTLPKLMQRKHVELLRLRKASLPTDAIMRDLKFLMGYFKHVEAQLKGWGMFPFPDHSTWLYDKCPNENIVAPGVSVTR
jgi:hypothetical protein